jgi:uncharacterized DUF497 family protein
MKNEQLTREIEFDLDKAVQNWKTHKVLFDDAALVFTDPMRLERLDDSEGSMDGEERRQTLGKVGKVLFVVYTERGDKTRIGHAQKQHDQRSCCFFIA